MIYHLSRRGRKKCIIAERSRVAKEWRKSFEFRLVSQRFEFKLKLGFPENYFSPTAWFEEELCARIGGSIIHSQLFWEPLSAQEYFSFEMKAERRICLRENFCTPTCPEAPNRQHEQSILPVKKFTQKYCVQPMIQTQYLHGKVITI